MSWTFIHYASSINSICEEPLIEKLIKFSLKNSVCPTLGEKMRKQFLFHYVAINLKFVFLYASVECAIRLHNICCQVWFSNRVGSIKFLALSAIQASALSLEFYVHRNSGL